MLLKCCLIHITIIILRHILYFVFLSISRPRPVYVVSCDLLFIFSIIFNAITHITSLKETHLFLFVHFFEYLLSFLDDKVHQESKTFSNSKRSAAGCCLAFACLIFYQYQPGVAYKSFACKKAYTFGREQLWLLWKDQNHSIQGSTKQFKMFLCGLGLLEF